MKHSLTACIVGFSFLFSSPLHGQMKSLTEAAKKKGYFYAYGSSNLGQIVSRPSESAHRLEDVHWASPVPIDIRRMKEAPKGWLPVWRGGGRSHASRVSIKSDAWVRRADVVLLEDFKMVVACWPIKSLRYELGDWFIEVEFQIDGNALVSQGGDEGSSEPAKARVYLARDVVYLKSTKGRAYLVAGLHAKERRIYPNGEPAKNEESFVDQDLNGCTSSPITQERK